MGSSRPPTLWHASELLAPIEISRMNSVRCPPRGAGPRVPFESFLDRMTSSNALGVATFAGIRPSTVGPDLMSILNRAHGRATGRTSPPARWPCRPGSPRCTASEQGKHTLRGPRPAWTHDPHHPKSSRALRSMRNRLSTCPRTAEPGRTPQQRKAPRRLKNPTPSTPRMSTNCGTQDSQARHLRLRR